jgi:hypothetical protein
VLDPPITRTTRTYDYERSNCIIIKKALIDLFVFDNGKMKAMQNKRSLPTTMTSKKCMQGFFFGGTLCKMTKVKKRRREQKDEQS